jgi:hypothetical protein
MEVCLSSSTCVPPLQVQRQLNASRKELFPQLVPFCEWTAATHPTTQQCQWVPEDRGGVFIWIVGSAVLATQTRICVTTEPLWGHKINKMWMDFWQAECWGGVQGCCFNGLCRCEGWIRIWFVETSEVQKVFYTLRHWCMRDLKWVGFPKP